MLVVYFRDNVSLKGKSKAKVDLPNFVVSKAEFKRISRIMQFMRRSQFSFSSRLRLSTLSVDDVEQGVVQS